MSDPAIFKALGAKMKYLHQRQSLIAQNIANANTPDYKPKDLSKVDFGRTLGKVLDDKFDRVRIATTKKGHIPDPNNPPSPRSEKQDQTYEVTPSGNAVILEEQSVKAGQTQADYSLMTSVYRKNTGMIMTALGRNR